MGCAWREWTLDLREEASIGKFWVGREGMCNKYIGSSGRVSCETSVLKSLVYLEREGWG